MKKFVIGVSIVFMSMCGARADILINEIQSSNDQTCMDENGETPDWVELYNNGQEDVNIGDWGLSDNPAKPFKWTFPKDTLIRAGDYLRIFCDSTALSTEVDKAIEPLNPTDDTLADDIFCWLTGDNDENIVENGKVLTWSDLSIKKNSPRASSSAPEIVLNAVNGHSALRFSSSLSTEMDLQFSELTDFTGFNNLTIIAIAKWSGKTTTTHGLGLWGAIPSDTKYANLWEVRSDGSLFVRNGKNTNECQVDRALEANEWACIGFVSDSNFDTPKTSLYKNGSLIGTADVDDAQCSLDFYTKMMFGRGSPKDARFFDGEIAEFLIINRALTQAEMKSVFAFLDAKYLINPRDNLHASFSLSASGESVVLTPKGAESPVDSVDFGFIPCDASYGRVSNGTWRFSANPTPGALNCDNGYDPPLAAVQFSVQRGIFSEPIVLKLYHEDVDAKIYYTTNHEEPNEVNGTLYRGEDITIRETSIVRATAIKDGALPYYNVASQTYLFLEDSVNQTKPETAPDVWVDGGTAVASYSVSHSVVSDELSRAKFIESIKAAPILSITLGDEEMFNQDAGLYCNPVSMQELEKAASVEWINGDESFGLCAGLKMHGARTRRFDTTPKKPMKLKFRSRYGASNLNKAIFQKDGAMTDEFDALILRPDAGWSWTSINNATRSRGIYMKDQLLRDIQGKMSGYSIHGGHVSVFINGMYWGLYNITESGDAAFAQTYWGGEKRQWNCVKNGPYGSSTTMRIKDGSGDEFKELLDKISMKDLNIKENYSLLEDVLDVKAFADYMLLEYYANNTDWPNNNWIAVSSKELGQSTKFLAWDLETTLYGVSQDRVSVSGGTYYGPQRLERQLESSIEYRMAFADRVHKHLFNDGALTYEVIEADFEKAKASVRPRMYAESARWGAYYYDLGEDKTIYGEKEWDAEYERLLTFMKNRKPYLMSQLKAQGLYPSIDAPEFARVDEEMKAATLSMPSGTTVYYTTDGTDPRVAFEGTVNPVAFEYVADDQITVDETSVIKARALSPTGEWSALSEIELEGSEPELVKNMFLPSTNGENWDKAANWSEGYYPNEPGSYAVIGVPTAFKKDKGWRNIHINKSDVTVGHVEITSGGCTNRIDTGKSGNLTFCGNLDENGVALEDATFVVLDENDTSLSMIDLDEPNKVILGSDTEFVVSNIVGDVMWGGLLAKGVWDGAGHNLAKSGAGRMTLDVTNAPETSFGKIQVAEGSIDITKKVYAEAITKDGTCSAALGSTDLATAIDEASVLSDKVSVNNVRLFIPSYVGGATYYGAFVANSLTTTNAKKGKTATAYIRDNEGDTWFNEKRYRLLPEVEVKTKTLDDGRVTYSVKAPMQDVTVIVDANGKENVPDTELSIEDAIHSVKDCGKIVIKGASEISVDNAKHTISVDGVTYSIADYYNAEIVGKWIQLAFNENAVPRYAESEVGADDALVIGEDGVSLGVQTKVGLYYTIQSRASLSEGDWVDVRTVHGNGAVQKLDAEKLGVGGFYRVVVTDK